MMFVNDQEFIVIREDDDEHSLDVLTHRFYPHEYVCVVYKRPSFGASNMEMPRWWVAV